MTPNGLKFNGEVMPTPAEITFTNNKIWSENTGRSATCLLVGDLKTIKKTISIVWTHLNGEQIAQVNRYISNVYSPFFSVTVIDETFQESTYTVYAGDPTYEILSWDSPLQFTKNVSVNLIEQ